MALPEYRVDMQFVFGPVIVPGNRLLFIKQSGQLFTGRQAPGLADETVPDNPAAQQAKKDKTDYEFGGQVLTLTEPKTDVAFSEIAKETLSGSLANSENATASSTARWRWLKIPTVLCLSSIR